MKTKRVLFLATSQKTRGGVTAVVKAYEHMPFWKDYKVRWIETHIDRHIVLKLLYALVAFGKFLVCVWRYDLIHIHTSELPSVQRKYIFFKIAKALRKKVVVHLHIGNQIDEKAGNRLYSGMFRGADAVIVLSQSIRQKVVTLFGVPENKVHVIYNPCPVVDSVRYTDQYKEVLFAGTLNHNKGYSVLIRAFARIAASYPDWKLCVAGNGELVEAKRLVSDFGIENQVSFLGWVREEVKDKCFRRASIFCLASYREGFPMAVLDAWAYGLPVISTPVGGLPDVLTDNQNVLFFEPGDVEGLAYQLGRLMADVELRYRLSEASLSQSKVLFSTREINKQIDSLYKCLL